MSNKTLILQPKRAVLSALLAVALALTMLPAMALAQQPRQAVADGRTHIAAGQEIEIVVTANRLTKAGYAAYFLYDLAQFEYVPDSITWLEPEGSYTLTTAGPLSFTYGPDADYVGTDVAGYLEGKTGCSVKTAINTPVTLNLTSPQQIYSIKFKAKVPLEFTNDSIDFYTSQTATVLSAVYTLVGYTQPEPEVPEPFTVTSGYGGSHKYNATEGTEGTYTFTPQAGYALDVIYVDGVPYDPTNVSGKSTYVLDTGGFDDPPVSVVATYAHTINFLNPDNGLLSVVRGTTTLSTGDIVRDGEILTIIATPDADYELDGALTFVGLEPRGKDTYEVLAPRDTPTPSVAAAFVKVDLGGPERDSDGAYLISTAEELVWFSGVVNAGNVSLAARLAADIDLSQTVFTPIAFSRQGDALPYSGSFDGDGHSITLGQFATQSSVAYGVFGCLGAGALVKDLTVAGSAQEPTASTMVGGIGAVAGVAQGATLENCVNQAALDGVSAAGGIVGTAKVGTIISNCVNNGDISTLGVAGGIVGSAPDGSVNAAAVVKISNCQSSGTIICKNNNPTGGILGQGTNGTLIEDCTNAGDVSSATSAGRMQSFVGGIAGSLNAAQVARCSNSGVVTCDIFAGAGGGIVGSAVQSTTITSCTNYGNIKSVRSTANSSSENLGGIVGLCDGSTVTNCFNSAEVRGNIAGGIAGSVPTTTGSITGCVNYGPVFADVAGGILGFTSTARNSNGASVLNCYNGGAITAVSGSRTAIGGSLCSGGIVGSSEATWRTVQGTGQVESGNSWSANTVVISNNYNTGAVQLSGEAAKAFSGPILGQQLLVPDGIDAFNPSTKTGNLYAADCIAPEADASDNILIGDAVGEANSSVAHGLLANALAATVYEPVYYNLGGYPVPESLWDGLGGVPGGEDVLVTARFTIAPVNAVATVTVVDAAGVAVEPLNAGGKTFELTAGKRYTYTVLATGFASQSASLVLGTDRLVAVGLRPADVGQYLPGWDKQRPSFGIYLANPDGTSGIQIGNWVFDEALRTYVDPVTRLEAPFIQTFEQPLVYSGKDRLPAARLGVVKKGILASSVIDYYNSFVAAHPAYGLSLLDADSVEDFNMLCATNSSAAEDPYTSNDPSQPGRWDWTGWDDSLTGVSRSYYRDWVVGVNNGSTIESKVLGEGTAVPSLLAITSYQDRINRLPESATGGNLQIDNDVELNAAIAYLLSVADEERALRNFTGMLADNSTLPLGADDSYYVGSVWITPPAGWSVPLDDTPAEKVGAPGSGDIDGDTFTTAGDAIKAARFVVGLDQLTAKQVEAADIDGDGKITMADVVKILRKAAGLV